MKPIFSLFLFLLIANISSAQSSTDKDGVTKACMNYLEGFYEGDSTKLMASLKPKLYKYGYYKDDKGNYNGSQMTYQGAIDYANSVKKNKRFPKANVPKKVEVLDVMSHIAAAKVTAWWGYDYILLTKEGDQWMIEEVLWQGPLEK